MNILWEYRFIIVIAVAVILFAFLEWQKFKTICYELMLQAKSLAKDAILKSGDQQAEWVVKKAFQYLPKRFTVFITEDRMRKIVFYLYHKAKDYLDDGEFNGSVN